MQRSQPTRKKIRLQGYDYSRAGCYFVTICTKDRIKRFGEIVDDDAVGYGCRCLLSETGKIVETELRQLETRYDNLKIDKYVIMPDHIHAIIVLDKRQGMDGMGQCHIGREQSPRPTAMTATTMTVAPKLTDVICAYKSITAKAYNRMHKTSGNVLWQTRFYDRVIRDAEEYQRVWRYIDENPLRWDKG